MATKLSQVLFEQTLGENQSAEKTASSPVKQDASDIRKIMDVEQKQHEKEQKTDDKLIKAIVKLTDSMNRKDKALAKGGVGGWLAQKKSDIKSLFSVGGAAKAIGKKFGVDQDDGSLAGAVLGSITKRAQKKQDQKEFGANFTRFTKQGRELATAKDGEDVNTARERAAAKGAELFKKIDRRDNIISELSAKKKQAEDFGGTLDEKDQLRLDAAKRSKQKISDTMNGIASEKKNDKKDGASSPLKQQSTTQSENNTTVIEKDSNTNTILPPNSLKRDSADNTDQPISQEDKLELARGAVTGMREEYNSLSDEEKQVFKDANPEMVSSMLEGSLDELTKISQKQLDALLDLLKLQQPTEEDRLESRLDTAPPEIKKEAKKEEKSGIFGKIFDFLKGGFTGFFKNALGSFAGIAMKALGPLGAIVTTIMGVVGSISGSVGKLIGGGASKLLGAAGGALSTVGSSIGGLASKGAGALSTVGSSIGGLASKGASILGTGAKAAGGVLGASAKPAGGLVSKGAGLLGTGAKAAGGLLGTGAKAGLKMIPGIGLVVGGGMAIGRAIKGDWSGAAMEAGQALASTVPGVGTAASIGLQGALLAKDAGMFNSENNSVESSVQNNNTSANLVEKVKQDTTNNVIEKTSAPVRVEQSQTLQQNTEIQKTKELEKEKLMMAKQQQAAPTIVQSPTNIVNNTSKINTRVAPRNLETQFNNRLRQIYA